ncbi:hypothetical protein [Chlorogloea sp. CCALA 695]|uniref:hypothetical protein n=1 Tax=Chlorogloea sp. CCALA 695 TaxID=2107693 RepID=UPI000D0668A3|nr:hypothetical protein [Chlorogloea sp. CCALA 695]PSB30606.1 hypothetical protein C7B70_15705 [Chlorogloea sp. CCALA 695]
MYEQVDFHFRYQAGNESLYALLLRYLQAKKHGSRKLLAEDLAEFPKEQMVLWALFAFWHPLACKALGSFNETQLKQKARNAIYQLLQHINYLIEIFDLDPQEFMLQVPGQQPNGKTTQGHFPSSKSVEPIRATSSSVTTGELPIGGPNEMLADAPELTRNEDDQLLEEVFNS